MKKIQVFVSFIFVVFAMIGVNATSQDIEATQNLISQVQAVENVSGLDALKFQLEQLQDKVQCIENMGFEAHFDPYSDLEQFVYELQFFLANPSYLTTYSWYVEQRSQDISQSLLDLPSLWYGTVLVPWEEFGPNFCQD